MSAEHSTGTQSSDLTCCERNQLWQGKRLASQGTLRETWFIFPHLPLPVSHNQAPPPRPHPLAPSGMTPGSISEEWKGIIWKKILHSSVQSHFLDVLESLRPSQWLSLPKKIFQEVPCSIVMRERQGSRAGCVMTIWPSLSLAVTRPSHYATFLSEWWDSQGCYYVSTVLPLYWQRSIIHQTILSWCHCISSRFVCVCVFTCVMCTCVRACIFSPLDSLCL